MSIEELRLKNKKDLALWSASVKVKELKEILKNEGVKGLSKYKKIKLISLVLDLVVTEQLSIFNDIGNKEVVQKHIRIQNKTIETYDNDETEFVDAEIISEDDLNSVSDKIINDIVEDFDVKEMIEHNLNNAFRNEDMDIKLGNLFGVEKTNETNKTKKQYVWDAINKNTKDLENLQKDIQEVKDAHKTINEINDSLQSLGSGLKADLEICRSYSVGYSMYIYAENVCIEVNYDYGDSIYIPAANKEWGKYEFCDEHIEWLHENCTNKECLYIIYEDNTKEIPLKVNSVNKNITDYTIELFNSSIIQSELESEWYNIEGNNKLIKFSLSIDFIDMIRKINKGQEIKSNYISYNALLNLEQKLDNASRDNLNFAAILLLK